MIGIVDYGMGNLLSVYNAFDYLGEDVLICKNPEDLSTVDRIVIPGVGAFKDCINRLRDTGFQEALNEHVLVQAKPTLGICLGMQVMGKVSYEFGEYEGLGWFDGEVVKIDVGTTSLKLPNIGWNEINFVKPSSIFNKIPNHSDFYLVHSYFMNCKDKENIIATYPYAGHDITAAICKNNILATQFHPEKSQDHGLRLLENFIDWKP
jgi:glutamine amidotransferase